MALKAVIDKLEDAPEAVREYYRQGTEDEGAAGKFILDAMPVGGFALENVEGLKSALGKERTSRESLEKTAAKFKDMDADKVRAALEELEALKKLDPKSEADKIANAKVEAAKAQLIEAHQAELKAVTERAGHLSKTVEELLIDQAATAALAEAKGSVEVLLPHVRRHTRVKEADGKFSVEVIDREGNGRIADGKGTPMDIKGLVAEMRQSDTFSRCFDGDGQSGTGKTQDSPGAAAVKGNMGGSRQERTQALAAKYNLPAA